MEEKLIIYKEAFNQLKKIISNHADDIKLDIIENMYFDSISFDFPQNNQFDMNPLLMNIQTAIIYIKEIGYSKTSIISILLKHLFMSQKINIEKTKLFFGQEIVLILEGLSKVNKLYDNNPVIDTDNFRDLLMIFAQDMRAVFIIIAERVNLMRQIKDRGDDNERKQIAKEASSLYAPLAHKLGLYLIKSELEDLSLKYLEPEKYYEIKYNLNATKKSRDEYINRFIEPIEERLNKEGLNYHIKGRTKSIHSIWQKMIKQKCGFNNIYDLFAIRIIIDSEIKNEKADCWRVYSIITDMYIPNTKRLRDWISVPKSNGYESLHITVMGPEGKWVEVQIRSERMDEIAEKGIAAHWRYKGVKDSGAKIEEWLKDIRMSLELSSNGEYSIENQFKVDIYNDDVFVFTPKGDLFKLPQGSSVLDFAYAIHTNIGSHCNGGRVNGKNVSLRTILKSGDQVEILTNIKQTPKRDWLAFAKTAKARSKIKQQLKEQELKSASYARETIGRKLKNRKLPYDESIMMKLIKRMGYKHVLDFYSALNESVIDINLFIEKYENALNKNNGDTYEIVPQHSAEDYVQHSDYNETAYKDMLVIDKNVKGVDYSLAKCCNPIYGDNIFGFVTSGRGIKIHRDNCPNAKRLKELMSYRVLPARWSGKGNSLYAVTLMVIGNDDIGIVNNITSILSKESNVLLRSINIRSAEDGLFSGTLTIQIDDNIKLKSIIKKIKAVKGVKDVLR